MSKIKESQKTTYLKNNGKFDEHELITNNYTWMLRLAQKIIGELGLAEDVVQESFISALAGLDKFEHKSNIETWLRRITINHSISKLRQLKRLAEDSVELFLPEFDELDCRVEQKWAKIPSPDEIMERKGVINQIEHGLRSLPKAYELIVRLRDIEGYSTQEVAEILNISESNVKVRLHRGRSALKKILEPILRGGNNEDE